MPAPGVPVETAAGASVNPDSWVYSYVERVVVAPSCLPRSAASPSAPGFGLAPLGPATGPIPLRMPR
ncbi:hypothetical protein ACGFRB_03060 [Streptomyces sp. NPDC048718]|uniref:hypothetical protein n=1 Tax=Streptomyces sp. NPDC048718 TaxID=3365587 RepID=UPI00371C2F3A